MKHLIQFNWVLQTLGVFLVQQGWSSRGIDPIDLIKSPDFPLAHLSGVTNKSSYQGHLGSHTIGDIACIGHVCRPKESHLIFQ